jgi:type I restriction enzyme R subunit
MISSFAESHVEEAALAWMRELGYAIVDGPAIAPDSAKSERESYSDVVLVQRLRSSIALLNPALPPEAQADAVRFVLQAQTPSLIEENRRLHRAIVEGVNVEFFGEDGVIRGEQVRLVDFDDSEANDWLAVNQFTVIEGKAKRRPDVVIFINGLPLGIVELKNPGDENATLDGAFNQLQTYKAQVSSLFRTNAVLVISDGINARNRLADGGPRALHALANRDWRGPRAQRHARAGNRPEGRLRQGAVPRAAQGLHRLRRYRRRCHKDPCRLSPVPRRAACGTAHARRHPA